MGSAKRLISSSFNRALHALKIKLGDQWFCPTCFEQIIYLGKGTPGTVLGPLQWCNKISNLGEPWLRSSVSKTASAAFNPLNFRSCFRWCRRSQLVCNWASYTEGAPSEVTKCGEMGTSTQEAKIKIFDWQYLAYPPPPLANGGGG